MSNSGKKPRSVIVRLIVLAVAGYMLFTLIGLFGELNDSQQQLIELKAKLEAEELSIEQYKALLADGSHAKIIEKAARERLGYLYSYEEVYIDISGN